MQAISAAFADRRILEQLDRCTPPALRGNVTGDMMLANALMEVKSSTYLQRCTPISVIGCVIRGARLGLVIDGVLGHAYMIPRNLSIKTDSGQWQKVWTANFQLGYRGIAHLCYRSDGLSFRCRCVGPDDAFEYDEGLRPLLKHQRNLARERPLEFDEIQAAYSVCTFPDGRTDFRVFGRADLVKARSYSDSHKRDENKGPWAEHAEAMVEKSVLIKHSKQLPLTGHATREIVRTERGEIGQLLQTYAMSEQGVIEQDRGADGALLVEHDAAPGPAGCTHPGESREPDGTCGLCGEQLGGAEREPGSEG